MYGRCYKMDKRIDGVVHSPVNTTRVAYKWCVHGVMDTALVG